MLIVKEKFFDRFDQTFRLFKNNFVGLFLPLFLYNFISVVVIGTISKYYMMKSFAGINDLEGLDFFSFLNNSTVVIGIVIGMILFILYLLFYVAVFLGLLKSFKQAVNSEEITILENVKYGISRFNNSMKTYRYIFAYIALIPSIIFIFGGLLFNAGFYYKGQEMLKQAGIVLIVISVVIFVVFSIYRGVKAKFALYSAVNEDDFTKENFNHSLDITNNNWRRIVGNLFLVGLLVSLLMSFIGGVIGMVGFFGSGGGSILESIPSSLYEGGQISFPDINEIKSILENYTTNYSIFGEILSNTIDNILTTISSVFLLIFTYLFFIRLKYENTLNFKKPSSNGSIEL